MEENKLKIVSIVPYRIFPVTKGGQKAIVWLNRYLAERVQLTCITVKDDSTDEPAAYPLMKVFSGSRWRYINVFYFFRLKSILKEEKATHLWIEHPYFGWLGILLKNFCNVKLVIRSHNIEALRWKMLKKWWWPILWKYEKWVHSMADHSFFIQQEDLAYAITQYKLDKNKCSVATYGIELRNKPSLEEAAMSSAYIRQQHNIPVHHSILLFAGSFEYAPNVSALRNILTGINPVLAGLLHDTYTILICGKGVPEDISKVDWPHVILAGFVKDIDVYFKGADVFLNPVNDGGGIKTKLVEALGNNLNAVSTLNGAIGVPEALCNGKLVLVENNNWEQFGINVSRILHRKADTPPAYYEHFYWGNIAREAAMNLQR